MSNYLEKVTKEFEQKHATTLLYTWHEAFNKNNFFKERKQTSGNASTKDVCLLTI
jgi:hypothetical protein